MLLLITSSLVTLFQDVESRTYSARTGQTEGRIADDLEILVIDGSQVPPLPPNSNIARKMSKVKYYDSEVVGVMASQVLGSASTGDVLFCDFHKRRMESMLHLSCARHL